MTVYRVGTTLGGKIGCVIAALVGVLLIGVVFIISAFGYCAPDVQCRKEIDWPLMACAIALAAVIGFGVRWLTNWIKGRWSDNS